MRLVAPVDPMVTFADCVVSPGTESTTDMLLMVARLVMIVPFGVVPSVLAVIKAERDSPDCMLLNVTNWETIPGPTIAPPVLEAFAAVWLYVSVRGEGTEVILNVPLKLVLATPWTVMVFPTRS